MLALPRPLHLFGKLLYSVSRIKQNLTSLGLHASFGATQSTQKTLSPVGMLTYPIFQDSLEFGVVEPRRWCNADSMGVLLLGSVRSADKGAM